MAAGCKPSYARAHNGGRGGSSRLYTVLLIGASAGVIGLAYAHPALAGIPQAPHIFNSPLRLSGGLGATNPSIALDGTGAAYIAASGGPGLGCMLASYGPDGATAKFLGRPEGGTGCAVSTGPSQQGSPMSLAYLADAPGQLIFSRSTNGGKNFTSQEIANMTSTGPGAMVSDPQLGLSGLATTFALVHDNATGLPLLATSIDGGLSYGVGGSPVNSADLAPGTLQGAQPVAGNLTARRDDTGLKLYTVLATADGAADAANLDCIYLAVGTVSPSNSATAAPAVSWRDYFVYQAPGAQLNRPQPVTAVDSAGHVYIAFSDGSHVYAKSDLDGTRWNQPVPPPAATATATAQPTATPEVTALPSPLASPLTEVQSALPTPTAPPVTTPVPATTVSLGSPLIAVDQASGIPGGLSSSVYPALVAGGNGLVDLVWYGATNGGSTADPNNQWSVLMAQSSDMGVSWTAYPVTSQIIHQGALCVSGDAACAGAQQSPPDPSHVPGLQLALDQVSGAALVAYDDDAASPGLPALEATRQCGGLSAVSGQPLGADCAAPQQPPGLAAPSTCPGPQITDAGGDAVDNTSQGSGANVLSLDLTQEVLNQDPNGDLQIAMAVQYLDQQPTVSNIDAETWAFYWTYQNVNYYAEGTTTKRAQPSFLVGTMSQDGTPAPGHAVSGVIVPGGGGNIVITVPAADVGNPSTGATLDHEYAMSYATFTTGAPSGGLILVDRAPDAGFGAPSEITLCPPAADIPEVPVAAMLPVAAGVGGAILLGLRRKRSRHSVKGSDQGGTPRGGAGIPVSSENSL